VGMANLKLPNGLREHHWRRWTVTGIDGIGVEVATIPLNVRGNDSLN
jgi:hypothetical protein